MSGKRYEPVVTRIIECVDPEAMKLVAALMDDPQPIHWDTKTVGELGLGDHPVNQGPIAVSYLLDLAVEMVGDAALIRRFRCRFLRNVFAGDRVECSGVRENRDGEEILILVARVGDEVVLEAEARLRAQSHQPL
jgi:acyl dehydratase